MWPTILPYILAGLAVLGFGIYFWINHLVSWTASTVGRLVDATVPLRTSQITGS